MSDDFDECDDAPSPEFSPRYVRYVYRENGTVTKQTSASPEFDASKRLEGKKSVMLCPGALVREVGAVMDFGQTKPGRKPGGWLDRIENVDQARTYLLGFWDALERHVLDCKSGGVPDPLARDGESGLTHVGHIGANVGMILGVLAKFPELETGSPF